MKQNFRSAIVLSLLCMFFISCYSQKDKEGSILPQYKITDEKLDSVTSIVLSNNSTKIKNGHKIVMELNQLENDTVEVVYSFHRDGDHVRDEFINTKNERVIGYIEKEKLDILVFSNIDNYYDLNVLSSLINVESGKKRFEYLFLSPIPGFDFESIYEPLYWHFKYIDGKFSQPSIHL